MNVRADASSTPSPPSGALDARRVDEMLETGRRFDPLPLPAGRLVGRRRELDDARRLLLEFGCRLLTLTGAGGTGKTRLALELGHSLAPRFPDGVCMVDLSGLDDHQRVMPPSPARSASWTSARAISSALPRSSPATCACS